MRHRLLAVFAAAAALVMGAWQLGSGGASAAGARAAKGAVKLLAPGGKPLPGRWQSWADGSLMPTVGGRVTVRLKRCPARPRAAGCVYTRRPRVVYVRPGLRDPRGVLLHELGHVYDLKVMNNRDRGRFRRLMRARGRQWWRGSHPLAEQFAEAYSWCARYARIVSISRYSSYEYRPSARQHRRICKLVVRAARDRSPARAPAKAPPVTGPHPPPPPPPSSAPGTVPGDPKRDPGPQPAEDPDAGPGGPSLPLPLPTRTPTPAPTPGPLPLPSLP